MSSVVTLGNSAFVARWSIKPELRETFLETFKEMWKYTSSVFDDFKANFVYVGWDRDYNFVCIESFRDEEKLKKYRETAPFQDYLRKLYTFCDASMTLELFSGMEGARTVFEYYPAGPSAVHPKAGNIGAVFL